MFERCHVSQNGDNHHPVLHCVTYAVLIPHQTCLNRELSNKASLDECYSVRRSYRDICLHFIYSYMAVTIFTTSQHSSLEYTCTFSHTKLKMIVGFSRYCQLRPRMLLLLKTII